MSRERGTEREGRERAFPHLDVDGLLASVDVNLRTMQNLRREDTLSMDAYLRGVLQMVEEVRSRRAQKLRRGRGRDRRRIRNVISDGHDAALRRAAHDLANMEDALRTLIRERSGPEDVGSLAFRASPQHEQAYSFRRVADEMAAARAAIFNFLATVTVTPRQPQD